MTRAALMRRCVSVLVVLMMALAAALAGASPASAAAAPGTGKVKIDDWPNQLRWALPNTEEFYGAYMFKEADQPCSKEAGGNAYRYVMDYLDHTGEVFQMISHTTGTSVLAITDIGGARTDLPQLSSINLTFPDGMEMPSLYPAPKNPQNISGKAWCGNDFAQFGVTDLQAPFGFSFYSEPDAVSVKFIDKYVSLRPSWKKYWDKRYEKGFDARKLDSYCAQDNPFCLTASFLHCDQRAGDAPDPSLVSWCQTWNYNVAMYNARLMEAVRFYGTHSFDGAGNPTGSLKPLDVASLAVRARPDPLGAPTTDLATIGRDGYLARWAAAMALPDYLSYLRGLGKGLTLGTAVALGAAAGIAAFWLGAGLLGSLLIGAAVTAFTVFSLDCDLSGLDKCFAEMAANGMSFSLSKVPDATAAVRLPNMTSSVWKSTFNDIATVAVWMLLVLFIINLIVCIKAGRPQMVFQSFLGVFGFFLALSAGGAVLTLVVAARNLVTQKLAGGPGFINELTNTMIEAINKLGSDEEFTGWLAIGILCLISLVAAFVVLGLLLLSSAWIPVIIGILILQFAGLAAPGLSAARWHKRGTAILWSALIMPAAVALLWRVGMSLISNTTEFTTLVIGTLTLVASALVPRVVAGLFNLGSSDRLGIGAAALGAGLSAMGMGKALAGMRGGASMQPGKSAEEMTDDHLAASRRIGEGGGMASGIAAKVRPVSSMAGTGRNDGGSKSGGAEGWDMAKSGADVSVGGGQRGKHSAGDGRPQISAVADSANGVGLSAERAGSGRGDTDGSVAVAAGSAAGVGGVLTSERAAGPREGSGPVAGADGDLMWKDAASGESAPTGSGGSDSSSASVPPVSSVPSMDDGAFGGGSAREGSSSGAAPSSGVASSLRDGGTGGPSSSGTESGSGPAGGVQSAGDRSRSGLRPVPPASAIPNASVPGPTSSGGLSRPGGPQQPSDSWTHGWGGNVPTGSTPAGSIDGGHPSSASTPVGGGSVGGPPAGWPVGVPWGVPLDTAPAPTTPDSGDAGPGPVESPPAAVLPPWHAQDIPWGPPPADAAGDEDRNGPEGGGSR